VSELHEVTVTVNGEVRTAAVEARKLLSDFLREDLGLTGTHVACEHGVCGVCTVMLNGKTTRSCLRLAVQADGGEIVTVEGLATNGTLHPVQQAFHDEHALQCGFCTPGFLVTAAALLDSNPDASEREIRHALDDVLCRCTGYQNIVRAVVRARDEMKEASAGT
jgi:carbon-monoxide dehydrogenase small subunit